MKPAYDPRITPFLIAALVCAAAALARTYLIQPPSIAHACEANMLWWCTVRLGIIYTYAWHTIGEVAVALVVLAFITAKRWLATAALSTGAAALVLYCYEPGAFAIVAGALLLVGPRAPLAPHLPDTGSAQKEA